MYFEFLGVLLSAHSLLTRPNFLLRRKKREIRLLSISRNSRVVFTEKTPKRKELRDLLQSEGIWG